MQKQRKQLAHVLQIQIIIKSALYSLYYSEVYNELVGSISASLLLGNYSTTLCYELLQWWRDPLVSLRRNYPASE